MKLILSLFIMFINAQLLKSTKPNADLNASLVSKQQNFNPTNICASPVIT
jgi:hypothetical protein